MPVFQIVHYAPFLQVCDKRYIIADSKTTNLIMPSDVVQLFHALGLIHTQARPDRNDYIQQVDGDHCHTDEDEEELWKLTKN